MLSYISVAQNECKARVKINLLEVGLNVYVNYRILMIFT